jgi:hypothetical protein
MIEGWLVWLGGWGGREILHGWLIAVSMLSKQALKYEASSCKVHVWVLEDGHEPKKPVPLFLRYFYLLLI